MIRSFLDAFRTRFLTASSLTALALGIALGLIAFREPDLGLSSLTQVLDPIVSYWVAILKVVVIPLIIAYFIVAIVSVSTGKQAGRLGGLTFLVHTLIALVGLVLSLSLGNVLIPLSAADVHEIRPLLNDLVVPDVSGRSVQGVSFWEGLLAQVWTNPLTAVRRGQVLPFLFWTLLIALFLRRLSPSLRKKAVVPFNWIIDLGQFVIGVLLLFMPVIVLGFAFSLVASIGLEAVKVVAFYIACVCGLVVLMMALIYLAMPATAGISVRQFASALLPSQMVAIGSRSSMACLPTMIEAAEERLKLSSTASEFVLPLSVSTFKLSRVVTTPFKFFFLAHLFGVDLDPVVAVFFIAAEFALSYGSPGLPSGSFLVMLPVYVAAGIPVEGYVLLLAVDAIPDVFKTLLNVTEDLALAGIVERFGQKDGDSTAEIAIGGQTT